MRIAIYNSSQGFAPDWVEYCKKNGIDYKLVDVYASDIINQLEDCDAFMWHHHHGDYRDILFAKQLLAAVEESGKIVYPDFRTGWHFDDKVGEKYLFEALNLPLVPSYVFYDKQTALEWTDSTAFPKVFKLRGGAGSMNVFLAKNRHSAQKLILKAFSSGFNAFRPIDYFKDRYNKWRQGNDSFTGVLKSLYRFIIKPQNSKMFPVQRGYAYFQEFMPDNEYDTRVVVIDGKYALAEKRYVRKGDFRASGSGNFDYDDIDTNIVKIAFESAKKLKVQSVAFDFIYDTERNPKIVEICYGFGTKGLKKAPGYWTDDMDWHIGTIDFCGLMVKNVIDTIINKTNEY